MTTATLSILPRRLRVLLFLLGVSSGLPFAATFGTLQAWMKESGMAVELIAQFLILRIPFSLKFFWAPLFDRFYMPFLGRRRGWMLFCQLLIGASLVGIGVLTPRAGPIALGAMALLCNFFAASQDIVIDAHRRDLLSDDQLGRGTSAYIAGYRLAMMIAGGAALWMADNVSWTAVYCGLGAFMAVGVIATVLVPEPAVESGVQRLSDVVIGSLKDYFQRSQSVLILGFILLYKLGDNLLGAVSTVFILEIGFTKTEYFALVKSVGLVTFLLGTVAGGEVVNRIGFRASLWVGGALQMIAVLSFILLAELAPHSPDGGSLSSLLGIIIGFENIAIGIGTVAFSSFIGALCTRRFSATQYALLTSIAGVTSNLSGAVVGQYIPSLGWSAYFLLCGVMALPALFILSRISFQAKSA